MSREPRHLEEGIVALVGGANFPWFTTLMRALEGVDHRYAARRPADGLNSIWAVVNHISFWHELALRRLRGEFSTDEEANESGWSLPAAGEAGDWTRLQQELISRNAAFARRRSPITRRAGRAVGSRTCAAVAARLWPHEPHQPPHRRCPHRAATAGHPPRLMISCGAYATIFDEQDRRAAFITPRYGERSLAAAPAPS